ncbi:MAG: J domain-containing protein, partial [Myxococcales bacterium]
MHAAAASDPYLVLGVPRTATAPEIRAAYLALGARYHPDLHQGNSLRELATAKMAEINGAYEVLSDPAQRAALDDSRRHDSSTVGMSASNHTTAAVSRGLSYESMISLASVS